MSYSNFVCIYKHRTAKIRVVKNMTQVSKASPVLCDTQMKEDKKLGKKMNVQYVTAEFE